ncbi:hypothetical protein FDE04_25035 [Vibrio parahaemolyticus]|uniref:hypothetical protein n=2 Tax=Vibrio parahaemolyticus TaxID=670 RepID=UPI00111CEC87|nr:hypothetical protein [Vibrio parahaemolyticus]EGQ8166964.1 hypothetical protein [Vibrio parahaemolyticus]MBA5885396.1 hypothetical protein [Vibrio parahaemolyticus]MBA5889929.1 hypothetical protein [Vibrio parahaemolyticus]MBA5894439.1 hypothetical protein [Vibrio parahaemolyticus]MBA5898946.1 hypothetical protein [Vibrio parahaemolyticus]
MFSVVRTLMRRYKPKRKYGKFFNTCCSYGQIFGTEKQCLKYYNAWKDIFQDLFSESKTLQVCDVVNYESTFDLVNILIAASDEKKQANKCIKPTKSQKPQPTEKKGFWARIFG